MFKVLFYQWYYILILSSFQDIFKRSYASNFIQETSVELCGTDTETIELTKNGETSSMIVTLNSNNINNVCKLRVTAPKTHVINIQFVENIDEIINKSERHPPCVLSIFLPENSHSPIWKGDPCSHLDLTEIDLLTPDFKILWMPPSNSTFTRGRKIVLTAVGQGAVCKEPNQHTCMKIGWEPMLCISDDLVCDGIRNCPKSPSTSDEDEKLCQIDIHTKNNWEKIAFEILKRKFADNKKLSLFLNSDRDIFPIIEPQWESPRKSENTTTTIKPEAKPNDGLSQVLSKYGPWGYLMLGMLICGTVLLFCGLWECCIKKPKTQIEANAPQTPPTTVLIINNNQTQEDAQPPSYEDLDQPPSYVALFPNIFKQNTNGNDASANDNNARNIDEANEQTIVHM